MPESKKKTPIERDAAGDTMLTIKFRDLTFTIPLDRDEWPVLAQLALEDGKDLSTIRALVKSDEWRRFMATSPKNKDAAELMTAISEAIGAREPGESTASTD